MQKNFKQLKKKIKLPPTNVFMQAGLTLRSISSNNSIQLLFRPTQRC